ncbi:hypothetical protein A2G06_16560 (plasmid) [Geobacter anodireducens]|nr:hypothetical protein A2G06_16560 [Geobacter anodireducens]
MRRIAFVNQKGGVGKTTTVQNVGAGLARLGRRVLIIDLDPQANLTEGYGVNPDEIDKSVYNLLMGTDGLSAVSVQLNENLSLAPACIDLAGAEVELLSLPGKEHRLRKALESVVDYDYILVDCPPSLGQLTLNGLTAAQEVIIPIQSQFYAFKALRKLIETVDMVKQWSNSELVISGIVATLYDARKSLSKDVVAQLQEYFGEKLFKTLIRDNTKLAETPAAGSDVFTYAPNSMGSWDYKALCDEIAQMEDRYGR